MITMITRLVAPRGVDIVAEMIDDLLYNNDVPIVRLTGGLADSIQEWDGNGFTFYDFNGNELAFAVRRALDLYGHRNKWRALVEHIIREGFSWAKAAEVYHRMYTEL